MLCKELNGWVPELVGRVRWSQTPTSLSHLGKGQDALNSNAATVRISTHEQADEDKPLSNRTESAHCSCTELNPVGMQLVPENNFMSKKSEEAHDHLTRPHASDINVDICPCTAFLHTVE